MPIPSIGSRESRAAPLWKAEHSFPKPIKQKILTITDQDLYFHEE